MSSEVEDAMEKVLLKVDEAAQLMGIARSHAYRYVVSGELHSIRLGKSRRIPLPSLMRFIARLEADQRDPDDAA